MSNITIIGAGGTGIAVAADMVSAGHRVILFEQAENSAVFDELRCAGHITRDGFCTRGESALPELSTEPEYALADAEIIFVATVANRHPELVRLMAKYLHDGQTVCFFNGNCGSILLKHALGSKKVLVGETMGAYTSVRYRGGGRVFFCMQRVQPKAVAAYPAKDSKALTEKLSVCYACACFPDVPQKNVLETALNAPNVAVHLISSVVNIAAVERSSDFRLYRDGLSPAVVKLIGQVEKERDAVFAAFGFTGRSNLGMMNACLNYEQQPDPALAGFYLTTDGPSSVTHRYYTEDAYAGNCLLLSMADACGVEMPVMRAAVAIISAVNGADYRRDGLTLEKLGLSGLTPEQINQRLYCGQ